MYYVYKVKFDEYNAIYVGCTNNIRRRKDQHNENARNEKSYFGRFLKEHGIILNESDFEIIAEFENRALALAFERETTIKMNKTGVLVLNDLYSDHCSKVGMFGKNNPSSKVFVLIDMKDHTTELVDDLHGWCNMHEYEGVAYTTLVGTSKRKPHVHKNRYIVREIDEWNAISESEKEDLVSGKWYEDHLAKRMKEHIERKCRTYLVRTPNGDVIEVKNLDKFARDNGINDGNLHASLTNGHTARGYKVLKRLS